MAQKASSVPVRPSAWTGRLAVMAGALALIAFFLWQQWRAVSADNTSASAEPTASVVAALPAVEPALQRMAEPVASEIVSNIILQSTGSLDSGEKVAKLTVDGATAVYLSGDRLGTNATILRIRDGEVSVERNSKVENLYAAVRASTFGQTRVPESRPEPARSPIAAMQPTPSIDQAEPIERSYGAVLSSFPSGQLPALLGLQVGDTVLQVNGRAVAPNEDVSTILAELEARKAPVWLRGERNGQPINLRYKP